MPPYRPRLPAVARLRGSVRDEQRQRVAEALRAEEVLRAEQEKLTEELQQHLQERRAALDDPTHQASRMLAAQRYDGVLRSRQRSVGENLQKVEQETARRQEQLMLAERDVRAIEQLEARGEERHRKAEQREAQRALDEIASQRAQLKRREGDDALLPLR